MSEENKEFYPNTFQTPIEIIDNGVWAELSGAEAKALLVVIRKTLGWYKKKDRIANSQLTTLTGLSVNGAKSAMASLESKGLIEKIQAGGGRFMNTYSIKVGGQSVTPPLSVSDTQGVNECHPEGQSVTPQNLIDKTSKKNQNTKGLAAVIPPEIVEAVKVFNKITGNLLPASYIAGQAEKAAQALGCDIKDVAKAIVNYGTEYVPESAAKRHNLDRMLADPTKVSKWAAAKTSLETADPNLRVVDGKRERFLEGTGWVREY